MRRGTHLQQRTYVRRGTYRSRRVARRRLVAVLVLVMVGAAAWGVVTVLPGAIFGPTTPGSPSTGPTTLPPTTTTTTQPIVPGVTREGTYAVGTTTLTISEPPPGPGVPGRTLPTELWYPRAPGTSGSTPDRTNEPYPLLVFSQGFRTAVSTYAVLITGWASAGFVVAAPDYPHTAPPPHPTTPATPTTTNTVAVQEESDEVNHPHDLQVVIKTVLARGDRPGWVLSGLINPSKVAVVGQSDGGNVSLAVAANSQWHDPTVKAVVVLSGAEWPGFGGTYFSGQNVPILVVQGNVDKTNYPACSVQIYDAAHPPKYYLDLLGATHLTPYVQVDTYEKVVANVTIDFFDAELVGESGGTTAMRANGDVAGVAQLSSGAAAPTPPGTCIT